MQPETKPFAESCEENQGPIQGVLDGYLQGMAGTLLEIGSGTGQHAVTFAARFPALTWQTSDRPKYLPGIRLWIREANLPNLPPPLELDVKRHWPSRRYDAIFSANTAHIMSSSEVEALFRGLPQVLTAGGMLLLYGPFNYGGRYTSESNASFDLWLKSRDPRSGIKDFETLNALAGEAGMELVQDHAMPANNRTLVWRQT